MKIVEDDSGSLFRSDGSITYSDGTNITSEGAMFFNNGSIKFSDGAMLHTDLQITHANGTVVEGQLVVNAEGEAESELGAVDVAEDTDLASTSNSADSLSEDLESYEVVGTLDIDKITELWTMKNCDEAASGSTDCSLLGHLQNADNLLELMEALTAEDGLQINTFGDIVNVMVSEGMTPDANSYVATILAQDMDNKDTEGEGQFVSGVHCDHRELSCRNGLACYPKTRHCDLKADCSDFSDEDACSCRDRSELIFLHLLVLNHW